MSDRILAEEVSNNGTEVRLVQSPNMANIFVHLDVLNNGTDLSDAQRKNRLVIFVHLDVSNSGTEVRLVHLLNMDNRLVAEEVSNN
jgi:hypothetical protein